MLQDVISENDGVLAVDDGTSAPSSFSQGFGIVAPALLGVNSSGTITHYNNGFPFDANGRVVVEEGTPTYYSNGLPFTASGALAVSSTGVSHWHNGLPYASDGTIYIGTGLTSLLFGAAFQASLVPETASGDSTPTFTRASTATFTDYEGVIRHVNSGEARFQGARRVENLLSYSEDFSNAAWVLDSGVTSTTDTLTFDGTALQRAKQPVSGALPAEIGATAIVSVEMKASTAITVGLSLNDGAAWDTYDTDLQVTLSTEWKRYSFAASITTTRKNASLSIGDRDKSGSTIGGITGTISIRNAQLEDATGRSDTTTPSEYVSRDVESAPYHGANVDGVKYFANLNGNTVASNVVTEGTGEAIAEAGVNFADSTQTHSSPGVNHTVSSASEGVRIVYSGSGGSDANIKNGDSSATGEAGRLYQVRVIVSSVAGDGFTLLNPSGGNVGQINSAGTYTYELVSDGSELFELINWASGLTDFDISYTIKPLHYQADASGPYGVLSESGVNPADDDLTYPTADNVDPAKGTIVLDFAPTGTLLGTISLWGSYVDASNYTKIFHDGTHIVFRRRIGGVNYDATKVLTYAADTVYKIAARLDEAAGGDIFVDGVIGTNQANTGAMQLGTDFGVGSDGNSAEQPDSSIRQLAIYSKALSDDQVAAL